ncbi:DUF2125 domain-containing protein [Tropicimonas sp.]|uniref:DUF2125 domain-containing protein n=1 Tax=Tropicimonas sp. TaxID=2067044 RepID=UPI003A8A83E2
MKPVRLLWLIAIVALGWSAWWGWGAWTTEHNLTRWLEARRAQGWQAEWSDISVKGYPTRIDTTISGLTLANTAAGWVWNTPFFQILGLNYEKNHYVLVWADSMDLQTPSERIAVDGEDLRGSVTFVPGAARELDDATLVFKGLALSSDAGWTATLDEMRLASRPNENRANTMRDVALELAGLHPESAALQNLARLGIVSPNVERLNADLTVTFDRPWDRTALEDAHRPQPRAIDIRDAGILWGKLELRVAGDLTMDASGTVSGRMQIKATNWRDMLALMRQTGTVPDAVVDTIDAALKLLSGLVGPSDTLDIPLTFADGHTRIGIVPVGPAPVIRLP